MAFLVVRGASYEGEAKAGGCGVRTEGEKHERGETRPGTLDGREGASEGEEREGGIRQAETRLGTATPERAINDSGAEFRDAEILSV